MALASVVTLAAAAIPSLGRAQVAVPFATSVPFTSTSQVASFVVNLGTLPLRPELLIDAVPAGTHPNLQILGSPGPDFCPATTDSFVSPLGTGPAQLTWKAWRCQPEIGDLIGDTARINVRVLDFGTSGAPANVQLALRGVTTVPTSTQLIPYFPPGVQRTLTIRATKDTTV